MKKHSSLFSLLFLILLSLESCSLSATPEIQSIQKITGTPVHLMTTEGLVTPQSIPPSPLPSLSHNPTKTLNPDPLVLPPPEVLTFEPIKLASGLSKDNMPNDKLVISGEKVALIHFGPEIRLEFLPESDCLSTSPDGKWFAYCSFSQRTSASRWLIVESHDRKQQKQIPAQSNIVYFHAYNWLNPQYLIFPLMSMSLSRPYPMVIINPFLGTETELSSNYPGLKLLDTGPAPMRFDFSDVVYDPSLNYVIFPEEGSQNFYVLWDRQEEKVVAKVEDKGSFEHYPLWSPDGKQFAIALTINGELDQAIQEWFLVNREGQINKVTRFGEYFMNTNIGAANWSPDGNKLAFWLETDTGACPGQNLSLLDINQFKVINTCIPGSFQGDAPIPVWSLDSRYIAVRSDEKEITRIILVDVNQKRASYIAGAEFSRPIGWILGEH